MGLPAVIGRALSGVGGVEEAYLFGSWAARHRGQAGPRPNDIDLLVIGNASLDDLRKPLAPAEAIAGVYVNPAIVSRRQWESSDDPFIETVKQRPMVAVPVLVAPGP